MPQNPSTNEIGLENLPNVYISNIVMRQPNRNSLRFTDITVEYITYDNEQFPHWSSGGPVLEYCEIVFIAKTINQQDTNNIFTYAVTLDSNSFEGPNQYLSVKLPQITLEQQDYTGITEVVLEARMELKIQKFTEDLDLDLPGDSDTRHYRGPSFMDKLFDFSTDAESDDLVIEKPSGVAYHTIGDKIVPPYYHIHENAIMQGSRHRSTPHSGLNLQQSDIDKVQIIRGNEYVVE